MCEERTMFNFEVRPGPSKDQHREKTRHSEEDGDTRRKSSLKMTRQGRGTVEDERKWMVF